MSAEPLIADRRQSLVVGVLLLIFSMFLLYKGLMTDSGLGKVYVKPARMTADQQPVTFTKATKTDTNAQLSLARTVGLWVAALLTLCTFSYLYKDNAAYKLSESLIVGVSAGYTFVAGFWEAIVDKLLVKLAPDAMRDWAVPGLAADATTEWSYLVPLILGALLFARFFPKGGWYSQLPLAFVVGTFAGLRLISFLDADFVSQIRGTLLPLVVVQNGSVDGWSSLRNAGLVICTLACLTYFCFSIEHKGWVGRFARLGIWVLMITFGASFAFTVMGRITLLTMRFQFLFHDWLQL